MGSMVDHVRKYWNRLEEVIINWYKIFEPIYRQERDSFVQV